MHSVLKRGNMSRIVRLRFNLLPGSHVLIVFCHGTKARRFCDNNFLVHVLPFPGSKIYKYAPAYFIMSVYRSLIGTIIA